MGKSKDYESLVATLRLLEKFGANDAAFEFFKWACLSGKLDMCQACIDAGYDPNMRDQLYDRPLLVELSSSKRFTTDVADFLISNGAKITDLECDRKVMTVYEAIKSPLYFACSCGNVEMIKYFLNKGVCASHYDLETAIDHDEIEAVRVLLELGVISANDIDLRQLNDSLIWSNRLTVMELLLQFGASPNGCDLLNEAMKYAKYEMAELLLKYGADPNEGKECCPLHTAVSEGDIRFAKLLLDNGADVNIRTGSKKIIRRYDGALLAMDIAIFRKDSDMQKLLAEYGGTTSTRLEQLEALRSAYKDN